MKRSTWLNSLKTLLSGRRRPLPARPRRSVRLDLEGLEERLIPCGQTFLVNVLGDSSGQNGGTGSANSGDLRYCINQAITCGQQATIVFDSTVFNSAQEIDLAGALTTDPDSANVYGPTAFVIGGTANITITGPSAGLAIDGGNAERLFAVTGSAALTLQDLTLQNCAATGTNGAAGGGGGGGAGLGGAVFNDGGTFTATNSTFCGNHALGGTGAYLALDASSGGGMGNNGSFGSFGIGGSAFGSGGFGGGGGGSYDSNGGYGGFGGGGGATANVGDDTYLAGYGGFGGGSGETGQPENAGGSGAGLGGAIFNNQGTLTLTNDTLTANSATGGTGDNPGAGLGAAVFTRNGTLTAIFDTFSNNSASNSGNDIFVLSDNTGGGNNTSPGDGSASATLTNDILGQSGCTPVSNFAAGTNGDALPAILSGTNNLISNNPILGGFTGGTIDASDPQLGPLTNNGGPTPTMAPLPTSPVLGAGVVVCGITTDQRGMIRGTPPDIGSYSALVPAAITVSTGSLTPAETTYGQAGAASTFTVSGSSLTADVIVAAPAGVELSTDGSAYFSSLTLTPESGTLATTTIFARFSVTAGAGDFSGNIQATSTGATEQDVSITGTVDKAHLTVTANDASRTYGAADPTFTDTITGFVNDEDASVVSGTASFTTPCSDRSSSAPGSTYTITVSQGTLTASNYDFTTFNSATLTVTLGHLTVTANDLTRTYGAVDPTLTYTITGFGNGEDASVLNGTPLLSLPDADTASSGAGSTYTIAIQQDSLTAANYDLTFVEGTLTVTPAPLTVTASDASRTYGAADPTFTDTITGFVNGEDASVVYGTPTLTTSWCSDHSTTPAGNTAAIHMGQGTLYAANYDFVLVDGTLSVTPAMLTVTANDVSRTYGAADPAFTDTITGFVNGQDASVLSGTAAFSTPCTDTATSTAGSTYAITASQGTLSASNYDFTFVNGTLSVTKAHLTVNTNVATRAYGAADPNFRYTVTGFVNGDNASVLTGTPAFSTPETDTALSLPGTTYAVTASQGTLSAVNYDFTAINGNTLTVTKAHLAVQANNATRNFGAPDPTLTYTITGFVNGDTASVVSGAPTFSTPLADNAASPLGSNYAITVSRGTLFAANYDFNAFTSGMLSVVKPTLTVTVNSASRTYGAADPTITYTITGFQNGDDASVVSGTPAFSISDGDTAASAAGSTYTITATQGTLAAANYNFTYVSGTLLVKTASLTVIANDASRTYGAADPTFTYTIVGFVNGDTSASLTALPALATTATVGSPPGSYAIIPSGAADANYSISYITGNLSVGTMSLTLTGTPGDDHFVLRMKPADNTTLEYSQDGGATFTGVAASAINAINVNSLSGNDTLTLDLSHGLLTGSVHNLPLTFLGGSGSDYLVIQGNPGGTLNETFTASPVSSGAGTMKLSDGEASVSTTLTNVTGIADTATAASLTINAGNQSNDILIAAGPTVNGTATNTVRGLDASALAAPDQSAGVSLVNNSFAYTGNNGDDKFDATAQAFMSLNFANKAGLTINGQGGNDLFDLETGTPAAGLQTLHLNGGSGWSVLSAPTAMTDVTQTISNMQSVRTSQVDSYISRLFALRLGRNASDAELVGWETVARNSGLAAVAQGIETSLEARMCLVKNWYRQYLGRAASDMEASGWAHNMVSGWTDEQVLMGILSSQEFYARAQTLFDTGSADKNFVSALYQVVLNRPGDANEVNSWAQLLPTLGTSGVSLAVVNSVEFHADLVAALYDNVLHRPAGLQEIEGWAASGMSLLQLRLGLLTSVEFQNG